MNITDPYLQGVFSLRGFCETDFDDLLNQNIQSDHSKPCAINPNDNLPTDTEFEACCKEVARAPIQARAGEVSLIYETEDMIRQKGGILLATLPTLLPFMAFPGIAAVKESTGEGYCLHLCPGGVYMTYSEAEVNDSMERAISSLCQHKIHITRVSDRIGRHFGPLPRLFKAWQERYKA